jgi:hypothetical protein
LWIFNSENSKTLERERDEICAGAERETQRGQLQPFHEKHWLEIWWVAAAE